MERVDYTGKRFGRLTVIGFAGIESRQTMWLCRCDCGKTAIKRRSNLQSGNTKSCGCRERMRHGHACIGKRSSEYGIWLQMNDRCRNSKSRAYKWYGARGIKVCERWQGRGGFQNFLNDMGPRPEGMSLDRKDNDGPYSPENCHWASQKEQFANRRCTRRVRVRGREMLLVDALERFGVPRSTFDWRTKRLGQSDEEALQGRGA